jgi:hypothetical protein
LKDGRGPVFLEVELVGLHLDEGVLHVCEADAEEDVLGALSPHAPRMGQPATQWAIQWDHLKEKHANNQLSKGNTCSEQIIYRKHMLRTDHLLGKHAKDRTFTGNTCS